MAFAGSIPRIPTPWVTMSGQTLEVTSLSKSETAQAGVMLGRAFQEDPMWVALVPDPNKQAEMLTRMFTALARTTPAARRGGQVRAQRLSFSGPARYVPLCASPSRHRLKSLV